MPRRYNALRMCLYLAWAVEVLSTDDQLTSRKKAAHLPLAFRRAADEVGESHILPAVHFQTHPRDVLASLDPSITAPHLGPGVDAGTASAHAVAAALALMPSLEGVVGKPERLFRTPRPDRARSHAEHGLDRWWRVALKEGTPAHTVLDAVEATLAHVDVGPHVSQAGPELRKQAHYTPNDPLLQSEQLVHYDVVGLTEAWNLTSGDASVVVQVIDSGIEETHPDLQTNKWANALECSGADGVDDDGNGFVDDCHGYNHADGTSTLLGSGDHGTACTGLIAATCDNNLGVCGVGGGRGGQPGVSYLTSTVFGTTGARGFAEALVYGADQGVFASSNSWGYTTAGVYEDSVLAAVDYAVNSGVVVIFAAGNANRQGEYYPGCYNKTLAVGAVNNNKVKSSYSNYGEWVDLSAPGDAIYSTGYTDAGSYGAYTGTSFATPVVAGALALAKSWAGPAAPSSHLVDCLRATATDLDTYNSDVYAGKLGGLLNVPALLACATVPSPAPTATVLPTLTVAPSSLPVPRPSMSPTLNPTTTRRPTMAPTEAPRIFNLACAQNDCWLEKRL